MGTIAVVGLGAMGSRIARRLLDSGHDLVVWNRSAARADELVDAGADRAESPADAARRAEVVLTMLADPDALRAVSEGPEGIAAAVDESTTVIEMSTVGPPAVARLREALPDAVGLLDAPVLGSLSEVESGSLRIFVGGPVALVERLTPLLSTLGSPLHVGPLGSGAAAKLVANTTLFGTLGVLGEALALAEGLGLSRETAFEVLAATPVAAQAERRRGAIESGDYPARFALALARKDADLVAQAAEEAGVDLRVAEAARSWLIEAEAAGWGERRLLGRPRSHPRTLRLAALDQDRPGRRQGFPVAVLGPVDPHRACEGGRGLGRGREVIRPLAVHGGRLHLAAVAAGQALDQRRVRRQRHDLAGRERAVVLLHGQVLVEEPSAVEQEVADDRALLDAE